MKIVVAVRCLNEIRNIDKFMRCYSFADEIVVSDGGSTDGSIEHIRSKYPNVRLLNFDHYEVVHGVKWNPDAPHMNFVLNYAKELNPDWLILDDMDDVPNVHLQKDARAILERCDNPQVNAFRLYMWGETQYFPHMNRNFNPDYTSLWAWRPRNVEISADPAMRHGTIRGTSNSPYKLDIPYCLLHRSWHPDTITEKLYRYNSVGVPMNHPFDFAGELRNLPEWAIDE